MALKILTLQSLSFIFSVLSSVLLNTIQYFSRDFPQTKTYLSQCNWRDSCVNVSMLWGVVNLYFVFCFIWIFKKNHFYMNRKTKISWPPPATYFSSLVLYLWVGLGENVTNLLVTDLGFHGPLMIDSTTHSRRRQNDSYVSGWIEFQEIGFVNRTINFCGCLSVTNTVTACVQRTILCSPNKGFHVHLDHRQVASM